MHSVCNGEFIIVPLCTPYVMSFSFSVETEASCQGHWGHFSGFLLRPFFSQQGQGAGCEIGHPWLSRNEDQVCGV